MAQIRAYAAKSQSGPLEVLEYDPGTLGDHQVEIKVSHCGICHSDLAMVENEWHFSSYPVVPGHEVIGTIVAKGAGVRHLNTGQRVGLGWFANSCKDCEWCVGGDHNLCAKAEQTIIGRFGGFADRVRCDATFALPIPEALESAGAAPLLCAGITVFNPMVQLKLSPTARVGVIGIGGLGHLALQFARAWGCKVTAFTSTGAKADEARQFGAQEIVNSRDPAAIDKAVDSCDVIISTVGAQLDWNRYLAALRPRGTLVTLGAIVGDISINPLQLLSRAKSVTSSPSGSPATVIRMLDFAARHGIHAKTELFPMSRINDAMAHVKADKARYRAVLVA